MGTAHKAQRRGLGYLPLIVESLVAQDRANQSRSAIEYNTAHSLNQLLNIITAQPILTARAVLLDRKQGMIKLTERVGWSTRA